MIKPYLTNTIIMTIAMEIASRRSFYFALFLFFSQAPGITYGASSNPSNKTVSAIFVFGDSTSDPGNNNYILTVFRSNFPPYGRDLPHNGPSRRFSNGRLTTDFVAEYVGIKKYIPPYLDPTLSMSNLTTGVSFASAGSGYDPLTTKISGVIPLERQLNYFRQYKRRVENVVGKEKMENIICKAVFLVGAGTNDFVVNYYGLPIRSAQYDVNGYQISVLNYVEKFIKALWEEGARKIALSGLPPMGCLPMVITTTTGLLRGCVEPFNAVAKDYNRLFRERLNSLQLTLSDNSDPVKIGYVDIFLPLEYMIKDPVRFGIEKVSNGCCGTGYIEVSFLCNPGSYVCPDPSKYVFWDSIHPTQTTYYNVFLAMRPLLDFFLAQ